MENMEINNNYPQEPSVKDFVVWLLIPTVLGAVTCGIGSLILLIVWACSSANRVRGNFAKAQLIMMVISTVLVILFYVIFGAALIGMSASLS